MPKAKSNIEIKNRRASFDFEFLETFQAGIVLSGTEIKSIRAGKASLVDCFCYFSGNELYVKNAKEFFDLYRSGDNLAKRVYEKWIKRLSLFFSNLQLLFNVQRYSVSGGVMKSRELFLNDLEKISNASISSFKLNPIKIVVPQFDQDIGVMGASSLVL